MNSKSGTDHIRGITRVVCSLIHNPLPILLSRYDGLIGHVIWGDILTFCPTALPYVLEKLADGDIFARIGPSLAEEIPRVFGEERSKEHAEVDNHRDHGSYREESDVWRASRLLPESVNGMGATERRRN